jgi:UDP-N-acetyl-L-fucosamine synthase
MKIATIVGTRPEIIRLSRVMAALDRYMEQTIIHTGQNYDYELNQIFFDDLALRKPDYFLEAAGVRRRKPLAWLLPGLTPCCVTFNLTRF